MSRFADRRQLLNEIRSERRKLESLLERIPDEDKHVEVVDGMSVKDLLAHRTEWGRMLLGWYDAARIGMTPAVPSGRYKWNQLKELNAEIHERFVDVPLAEVEAAFRQVHGELERLVSGMSEAELFGRHFYGFTGSSDLASYVNSATAAHYRSARKHIQKWRKAGRTADATTR